MAEAYQLQVQRNGGAWSSVRLASAKSRSATLTLKTGSEYRFRLRLRTPPSNWSRWAYSAPVKANRHQENSSLVKYSGSWRRVASGEAAGGYVRKTTARGASATFTFTGRAVAWVAPLSRSRGSARVYVDGVHRTTVSLYSSSVRTRRVVFRASWAAKGAHTIEIRGLGTAGHPRVDIDAFVVLR
jgi:hypothetical protein